MIFKRFKHKKAIKRFIELYHVRKALESNVCMERSCSLCPLLTRVDECRVTCKHEKCGDEMWEIYKKLFPKESPYAYTWNQKENRVRRWI